MLSRMVRKEAAHSTGKGVRSVMKIEMSQRLMDDLQDSVRAAYSSKGIVNVAAIAELVRTRNVAENVALEDITERVMAHAQLLNAAMEFDGQA
jgi:hypothetical protein